MACGHVVVVVPLSVESFLLVNLVSELLALSGPFTVHTASCLESEWADTPSLKQGVCVWVSLPYLAAF